ncbi:MAG TPA: hypothetical protein VGN25_05410 [Solirubrobacteraceae bacterium]|nr:hypothetical protein [Solirubrobacteraceae bacterium]
MPNLIPGDLGALLDRLLEAVRVNENVATVQRGRRRRAARAYENVLRQA